MEYPLDFLLGNSATIIGQVTGIAFVWVIFRRVGDINGWSLSQMVMVYGVSAIPFGLCELLFNGLWGLTYKIRLGDFDEYLIRPTGPLLWILSDEVAIHGFGNAITGVVIVVIASFRLNFVWTLGRIVLLAWTTICGVALYASINLITSSLSFWFVGTRSSIMYMVQRLRDFTRYPISIYALPLRILLLWVVPFAFTGFVPSAALLDLSRYARFLVFLPFVTIAMITIATVVWRLGLKRYQSTGS